jgi:uncharacterized membrane protein
VTGDGDGDPTHPLRPVVPARTRVAVSVVVGVVVGVPVGFLLGWRFGLLGACDTAEAVFLTWVWSTVWPLGPRATQARTAREDPTRATADLMLLTAAGVSLLAVGLVLASAARSSGAGEVARVALGVISIAVSWGVVHTVFTLRYARLYYDGGGGVPGGVRGPGGVDFNQAVQPCYRDFAYLAFTIGMTFQVSDTDLTDQRIRTAALQHALLSFVFGTGILATSINLVASLVSA